MYKPIYDKASGFKRIGELATWIFLVFLIPSTALGFFAEQSIPGQALFPVKLTIERMLLGLQFVSPQAQAQYQVGLVNKRFDEVQTLLTKDTTNADDLSNFGVQLQTATQYIASLPPSPEKTQLQQKLITNIETYQQELKVQQQVIQNREEIIQNQTLQYTSNGVPNLNPPTSTPIPTPTPNTSGALTQVHYDNTPTPFPSNTPAPTQPPSDAQNLMQINQALQNMQNQMQGAQTILQDQATPTPTPTIVPSDTPTPTFTPTPTITPVPYNPTSCFDKGGHCIPAYGASSCQNMIPQYNYPASCFQNVQVCCGDALPTFQPRPTQTPTPTPNHDNNGGGYGH